MVKLVQINLHHSRAACATLCAYMSKHLIDVALVQEPWTYKGLIRGLGLKGARLITEPNEINPRSCIRNSVKLLSHEEFCCRNLVAVMLTVERDGSDRDQPHPPPTIKVNKLIENCQQKG